MVLPMRQPPPPTPSDTWIRASYQWRPATLKALRVRAASDGLEIRETLDRAVRAYLTAADTAETR